MREAIAVDGSGSPPSMQIIFSAIGEQKEGHCALPLGEGKVLQDAAARRLGEPPPPLHKPLKIYPTFSDLRRPPVPPPLVPPSSVQFSSIQKPPKTLPKVKKDRDNFLKNKGAFNAEPASCREPPQGGLIQAKKKKIVGQKKN